MPDKKWMHSTKTYYTRSVPCNVFVQLAVAMGKGLAWATSQNSENQNNMFAWATWRLQWAKGGGWHVHTRNAETHSHAQSSGGGGHQPYSKHS